MNDQRGSIWRKWDLHVHTPASIEEHYPGSNVEEKWQAFLDDVEQLPAEIQVLGINDYLFLDGYERVLKEKTENNRLQNIKLLLPVVEFRIEKFAGIDFGTLKRINLHVIFSDELSPSIIKSQFLNTLDQSYALDPTTKGPTWLGAITRESLCDLGQAIKNGIPAGKHEQFGTDLQEGFNALNVNEKKIFEILQKSTYLKDKYIIAVGKTEWDQLKWSDASIGTKKDIINNADIAFTAAEDIDTYNKAKTKLIEQNVNSKLLDCSDAHYLSTAKVKDRIGNCSTWIKADATWEGLKIAIKEYEERVCITQEPDILEKVRRNSTKYIESVTIIPKQADNQQSWFNQKIELNQGLVAIIGNKGSGKSALTDIISLCGNAHLPIEEFSFLKKDKFRKKPENLAGEYQAILKWYSGEDPTIGLDAEISMSEVDKVQYLPQNYFERLCNELTTTGPTEFERQIEEVIFSHIPEAYRQKTHNLKELLDNITGECERTISIIRNKIKQLNEDIAKYEYESALAKVEYLKSTLASKKEDWRALKNSPLTIVNEPTATEQDAMFKEVADRLTHLNQELYNVEQRIAEESQHQGILNIKLQTLIRLQQRFKNIELQFNDLLTDSEKDLAQVNIKPDWLVTLSVNWELLSDVISYYEASKAITDRLLNPAIPSSLISIKEEIRTAITELQSKLQGPRREYEQYKQKKKQWREARAELVLNKDKEGSIQNLRKRIRQWYDIPKVLESTRIERIKNTLKIHECLRALTVEYKQLYSYAADYLSNIDAAKVLEGFDFKFDSALVFHEFDLKFFGFIGRDITGSFCGAKEGMQMLNSLTQNCNPNDPVSLETFLKAIDDHLHVDKRNGRSSPVAVENQLRKGRTLDELYDMIYGLEYLRPQYQLTLANKGLSQLSPGERGTVLLIFYLLMNLSETPLIVDQPEENLDNQSVYNLLRRFITWSKNKRQVIMVTHNPNLAVVCDADQIIYSHLDPNRSPKITYLCGSIENPELNSKLINVLEGTRPAFDKRDDKYYVN